MLQEKNYKWNNFSSKIYIYINAYKKNTEHVSNVWQIVDDLLYDIYNLLCVIYANYM